MKALDSTHSEMTGISLQSWMFSLILSMLWGKIRWQVTQLQISQKNLSFSLKKESQSVEEKLFPQYMNLFKRATCKGNGASYFHVAEQLVLLTSDHEVPNSNSTTDGIQLMTIWSYTQSLSCIIFSSSGYDKDTIKRDMNQQKTKPIIIARSGKTQISLCSCAVRSFFADPMCLQQHPGYPKTDNENFYWVEV